MAVTAERIDMVAPQFSRIPATIYRFDGPLHDYLTGVINQWFTIAPQANPAMLEMFRDRDRRPLRDLVPWAGEFAGKYLTSAVQVYRLTQDESLYAAIRQFVAHLAPLQDVDGYLGPWPRDCRLTGMAPNAFTGGTVRLTWDAWGHYHIMLGLLLWSEETNDSRALGTVQAMADLFCRLFLNTDRRLVDTGSTEMNLAVVHALCLLYRRTGNEPYLALAHQIVGEFAAQGDDDPLAGDYLRASLAGQEFYQMPKPRWESLHPILGLVELYWITGAEIYRQAFTHIWWSIVKLDRHNNGGFSSGERAQGSPYHQGAIETCCTVAWIAMSVEMLRLTGNSVVADELELSTLNSVLGYHSHTGRWVTYNTPMDGVRKASSHAIVFQAREGSPELNCCSVNGPRGLGMVSDWALMADGEGLVLNWYGPCTMQTTVAGIPITLTQDTTYPVDNRVRLHIAPDQPLSFVLKLRIPHWSANNSVRVNGVAISAVTSGSYCALQRVWNPADLVELELDFSFHLWLGEDEYEGKGSIYRGPLLLTYDRRWNQMDPEEIPVMDASQLQGRIVETSEWIPPILLMEFASQNGQTLRLCDFASAGEGGTPYRSWLPVTNVHPVPFSRAHPLPTHRV